MGQKTDIARVAPADWQLIRDLRLRALKEDPSSFGSTYAREVSFSEDQWKEWAVDDAVGEEMATFIAKHVGKPVGMIGAYRDETDRDVFHVIAMWVAPEVRREGIGRRLLSEIEDWIRTCRGSAVQLNVTTAAFAARRLYESAGYEPDGTRIDSPHTPGLIEVSLVKRLGKAPSCPASPPP